MDIDIFLDRWWHSTWVKLKQHIIWKLLTLSLLNYKALMMLFSSNGHDDFCNGMWQKADGKKPIITSDIWSRKSCDTHMLNKSSIQVWWQITHWLLKSHFQVPVVKPMKLSGSIFTVNNSHRWETNRKYRTHSYALWDTFELSIIGLPIRLLFFPLSSQKIHCNNFGRKIFGFCISLNVLIHNMTGEPISLD